MNREFLQLAHTYDPEKHRLSGMYVSEKLDGQRAFWDGGISRGLPVEQIPYANIAKVDRYKNFINATGLWSRYGHPIHAPVWFLDQLPTGHCLDGELYLGRKQFEDQGFVRALVPDSTSWEKIKFHVFDSPSYQSVFQDGEIKNPNFKKSFTGMFDLMKKLADSREIALDRVNVLQKDFHDIYEAHKNTRTPNVIWHEQIRLPYDEKKARDLFDDMLESVTDLGGEGLIARAPYAIWIPKRTYSILKAKPFNDAEGIVIGYVPGQGKYLGMLGSLVLLFGEKQFQLSGFTDEERQNWETGFPIGSKVTFRYRELTQDGIPREARYWRKRNAE